MKEASVNARVLVVDDNRDILVNFTKILAPPPTDAGLDALLHDVLGKEPGGIKPWAFQVETAASGAEAVEAVNASVRRGAPYAVAFVDIRMPPGIDGIETVRRLWAIDPDLQVVVCTAYSDYNWAEMAQRLPRISQWLILKKPFSSVEVLQAAHALAMKWHLASLQRERLEAFDKEMSRHVSALQHVQESAGRPERNWRESMQVAIRDTQRSIEQMRSTFERLRTESGGLTPLDDA